jgi:hypothetical protein
MSVHPAIPYSASEDRISSASTETSAPWYIWCGVFGVISIAFGLYWDISWHMSIGRDTFWTPAHMAIQLGGMLVAATSVYLILSTTWGHNAAAKATSIKVWGFRGPLGAFLACWGGVLMVTSAPFDNWWHNSFGLDVEIFSPPHIVLGIGILTVAIGALLLLVSWMNRTTGAAHAQLLKLYFCLGGVIITLHWILLSEFAGANQLHSPLFYRVLSFGVPFLLIALARASGFRWGATAVAAVYTVWGLGQLWLLPLFPATPKLGPVFTNITHMVPLEFPTLFIFPAIILDLLLHRYANKNKWGLAAILGAAYLAVMLLVNWPFGYFMISPAARNWIFGQNYFPYMESPSYYHYNWEFIDTAPNFAIFLRGMGVALVIAILSSRVGLAAGDALRRLRR